MLREGLLLVLGEGLLILVLGEGLLLLVLGEELLLVPLSELILELPMSKELFDLLVPKVTAEYLLLILLLVRALVLWSDVAMSGLLVKDEKRSVVDHSCRLINGDDGVSISRREIGPTVTCVPGGIRFDCCVAEGCCCC